MQGKHVRDSYVKQMHILNQKDLNGYERLFGGTTMCWIDETAALVARRHCQHNITTAVVDSLVFLAPAYANEILVLEGYITFTGRTSMEVCVKTYVEEPDGKRRDVNAAYLVMVAMDENNTPVEVPPLIVETKEEIEEFEAGKKRRALRGRIKA